MKKLFAQIVKFGIVGFTSFGIDYVTGLIVLNLVKALTSSSYFEMASLVGSVAGCTVSVIANYILSFKFVFERKEDLNKKVEFITFVVLSLIGMLLNSFLIWIVVGPIYRGSTALQQHIGYNLIYTIAKVFATAVVMVYNFITRKIFLEKKSASRPSNDLTDCPSTELWMDVCEKNLPPFWKANITEKEKLPKRNTLFQPPRQSACTQPKYS